MHRPGALAGATALVSARATGVFTDGHQPFWDTARRKAGDRDGTKALTGVLLLHRTLPTEAVLAGIDAAVGGAAPSSSGPGHPSGCGGPWRKFRYTLANFVSPDMPPGQPARAGLWTNTPGVKRRSQTGHGRPGVVPGSSRDGIWGVVFGAVMGLRLRSPLLGCRGLDQPSPGRDHQLLAPRGIPPIPGARSNRHRGAISS